MGPAAPVAASAVEVVQVNSWGFEAGPAEGAAAEVRSVAANQVSRTKHGDWNAPGAPTKGVVLGMGHHETFPASGDAEKAEGNQERADRDEEIACRHSELVPVDQNRSVVEGAEADFVRTRARSEELAGSALAGAHDNHNSRSCSAGHGIPLEVQEVAGDSRLADGTAVGRRDGAVRHDDGVHIVREARGQASH